MGYAAEEIKELARGRWPAVLSALGVDGSLLNARHGPCPGCGGRDRFRFDDRDGEGTWLCSGGGSGLESGDGIALLMHARRCTFKEAVQLLGEQVGARLRGGDAGPREERGAGGEPVAPPPQAEESGIPKYNEERLRSFVAGMPECTPEWFQERSPIDPRKVSPGECLEHLYEPGERVLVFTDYKSQGDFLWQVGTGGFRLAARKGVQAVRSGLPEGSREGVWFLCQPVTGKWHNNPRQDGRASRRSLEAVTSWRYLVLESDDAPEELWLQFLAKMPAEIAAVYSSGGRSWHALMRVDRPDKASFDALLRNSAKVVLPVMGADPGAMTPVRLTRLPGCMRNGRLQRLIYLNPRPSGPVIEQRKRREVERGSAK